jgi:SWI/SNF-related matrix-associated actin-dependent regulator of chromatin subfamily A3
MAVASRNIELIDSDDDDLDLEVCYGEYRGDIVGVRYYNGTVNRAEMVSLNREPFNPYDKNAIRVENVCGIQVGHIKRTLAMPLANVIDKGLVRLEG